MAASNWTGGEAGGACCGARSSARAGWVMVEMRTVAMAALESELTGFGRGFGERRHTGLRLSLRESLEV